MSFNSIIGQSLAVELCRKWLKQQTTNPLLFYGPDGVGKKMLALELAKALNCNPSPSPLAEGRPGLPQFPIAPQSRVVAGGKGAATGEGLDCCDECLSCRKISAGNHPDVRVIDLAWQAAERNEPLEKQQNLRIEMIMTERHRLLQSPVEGTWKVTLLDDAHRLTADAANVLLKTLEEPPANTAIFLLTPFRDRLFATIISRCQLIRFRSLSDDEMGLCLTRMKIPSETHPHLAEMALGSPGRAVHLSREEQIEAVQKAEHLWQSLGQLSPSRVLHDAGGLSKSSKPSRGDIEQHIHSLLVPATRALRAGEADASRPIQIIQSALAQLRHNVQPALVYDNLILQLARAKS